jgi:hypothetical protein
VAEVGARRLPSLGATRGFGYRVAARPRASGRRRCRVRLSDDTRGTAPYRPAVGGRARIPELPTTLPTPDETYGVISRDPALLADDLVARLRPGALEVHTIHAELEGGPHADVLDAFLSRTVERVRFVRLCDEADALDVTTLPICEVRDGTLPGRPLPVAVQQPPDAC